MVCPFAGCCSVLPVSKALCRCQFHRRESHWHHNWQSSEFSLPVQERPNSLQLSLQVPSGKVVYCSRRALTASAISKHVATLRQASGAQLESPRGPELIAALCHAAQLGRGQG